MKERESELRKGFRLYSAIFEGESAQHWRRRLGEPDGRTLVESLEEYGIKIQIATAVGTRGGDKLTNLHLSILHPDRPLLNHERNLINGFFPPEMVSLQCGFPETTEPLNDKWTMVYRTPKSDTEESTLSPGLQNEIEEILSPLIDLDVDEQDISSAISIAKLTAQSKYPEDQITKAQLQQRVKDSYRKAKIFSSGFYRVINGDTLNLNKPDIAGEFDNLEEARERALEIAVEKRNFWIKTYRGILNGLQVGTAGYRHCQRKLEEAEAGGNLTSTIFYIHGPEGEIVEQFPV